MWAQFISFLLLTILAFKLSPIPESADLGQILIGVGILGLGAMLGIATIIPCIRRLREKIAVLERNLDAARKDGDGNWKRLLAESRGHEATKGELAEVHAELANARRQLSNAWGATGVTTMSDHDLTLAQAIQQRLMDHRQEIARLEHQLSAAQYAAAVFEEEMDKLHDKAVDRELAAFLQGADYAELEIAGRLEEAHLEGFEEALRYIWGEVYEAGYEACLRQFAGTPAAEDVVTDLFSKIVELEAGVEAMHELLDETAEANWKHGFATAVSLLDEEVDGLVEALILQVAHNVLLELELEGALYALDDSIKFWMGRWAQAYKKYRAEREDHWQTQLELAAALHSMGSPYDEGFRQGSMLNCEHYEDGRAAGLEQGFQRGSTWAIAQVFAALPKAAFDAMAVADGFVPDYRPVAKAPTFTPNPADVQNAVLGLVITDHGSVAPHFLHLLHEADDAHGFGGLLPGGD